MADPLQSLNRILQSQQERYRFDVQSSLQMMQYAQQKKAQDIQIASETIKLAQVANEQVKKTVASNFLSESGLGQYYLGGTGDEKLDNLQTSQKELRKKGWSSVDADRITTALWAFSEAQDADPLVSLAASIDDIMKKDDSMLSTQEKHTFTQFFKTMGTTDEGAFALRPEAHKTVTQASHVKSNETMIAQEIMEFTKGDYDIQSDIGFYKDVKLPGAAINFQSFESLVSEVEHTLSADDESYGSWVAPALFTAAMVQELGGSEVAKAEFERYAQGKQSFLDQLRKDRRRATSAKDPGLNWKDFKKKYGVGKHDSFRTREGVIKIAKQARSAGLGSTKVISKAQSLLKGRVLGSIYQAGKTVSKYAGARGPSMFAPMAYRALGGAVGDELGEAVGGTLGTIQLINKVPGKMSFIKYLMKSIPRIAGKAGVIALADSPFVGPSDLLAAGVAVYEIYNTWESWKRYSASKK